MDMVFLNKTWSQLITPDQYVTDKAGQSDGQSGDRDLGIQMSEIKKPYRINIYTLESIVPCISRRLGKVYPLRKWNRISPY